MHLENIPMEIIGYAVTTSIGRKALFVGTMYFGGGLLITIFGLPTIALTGAISYFIL
jgi:hypothetical protein